MAGQTVARLKGGDPFIFGRGGEEALALTAAGIEYEVIPGVSSAYSHRLMQVSNHPPGKSIVFSCDHRS